MNLLCLENSGVFDGSSLIILIIHCPWTRLIEDLKVFRKNIQNLYTNRFDDQLLHAVCYVSKLGFTQIFENID